MSTTPVGSDTAIRVQNLSKCYQIYDNPRDQLKQLVMPRVRRVAGYAWFQKTRKGFADVL